MVIESKETLLVGNYFVGGAMLWERMHGPIYHFSMFTRGLLYRKLGRILNVFIMMERYSGKKILYYYTVFA